MHSSSEYIFILYELVKKKNVCVLVSRDGIVGLFTSLVQTEIFQ